jgi:shikimate dehydrogenase
LTPTACILGWPVEHSRSPLIHRWWLRKYGMAGDYIRKPVPPDAIGEALTGFAGSGLVGGNVTVPYKEAAFAACGHVSDVARRLGAVNTIWVSGRDLHGDNTDAHGFAANMDDHQPGWRDRDVALILGAGGAARAVIHAVMEAGYSDIVVLNRTPERAEALARHFGGKVRATGFEALDDCLPAAGLVVNATSAGMGGSQGLAVEWSKADPAAIATDIVYTPLVTPFLRGAQARGLAVVDGLGMLLHQAAPGFERWFGLRPAVDAELRALVMADLGS